MKRIIEFDLLPIALVCAAVSVAIVVLVLSGKIN